MKKLVKTKVSPIAFESLGVRSMCTYVETPDIKVLLDAGVSLGPNRYGFPPHPEECKALKERRNLMLEISKKTDVVTISHYHFDHHTPSFTDWSFNWSSTEIAENIYNGKIVFAKSYKSKINPSQRHRGWMFAKTGGKHADKLEFADERTFKFGATTIRFSSPVFHGREGSELGWVLMAIIERDEEKVLFAPDIQGPMYKNTLDLILAEKPQLAIVGGPPVYLADFRVSLKRIDSAMRNLESIVKQVPVTILDHHLLRDENWKETAQPVLDTASSVDHKVVTAAEYAGEKNNLLESRRKSLFETDPPSQEFMKWTKTPVQERKLVPPPI
jgi:predicted metallo-beta-lactamase superfamily hydrolase